MRSMAWPGALALIIAAANSCSEALRTSLAKSLSRGEKDLIVLLEKTSKDRSDVLFPVDLLGLLGAWLSSDSLDESSLEAFGLGGVSLEEASLEAFGIGGVSLEEASLEAFGLTDLALLFLNLIARSVKATTNLPFSETSSVLGLTPSLSHSSISHDIGFLQNNFTNRFHSLFCLLHLQASL